MPSPLSKLFWGCVKPGTVRLGRRDVWRDLAPADLAGLVDPPRPVITPDGKTYAYSVYRIVSNLYLVEGLK